MRPRNDASESSGRRSGTRNSRFFDGTTESAASALRFVLSLCETNVDKLGGALRYTARMFVGVPIHVNADSSQ